MGLIAIISAGVFARASELASFLIKSSGGGIERSVRGSDR